MAKTRTTKLTPTPPKPQNPKSLIQLATAALPNSNPKNLTPPKGFKSAPKPKISENALRDVPLGILQDLGLA